MHAMTGHIESVHNHLLLSDHLHKCLCILTSTFQKPALMRQGLPHYVTKAVCRRINQNFRNFRILSKRLKTLKGIFAMQKIRSQALKLCWKINFAHRPSEKMLIIISPTVYEDHLVLLMASKLQCQKLLLKTDM